MQLNIDATCNCVEKINEEIEDVEAKYKNPRNLCSGSIRQLNNEITASRRVNLYAFTLVKADGVDFENSREKQFLFLKEQGFAVVDYLKVTPDTILVSIMHTNNEIGSLQPIAEAGNMIKRFNPNIVFHVDAVQGYGKFRIFPKKMGVDLMSVSGHKIHGPKGIGILYMNEKVKIKPISYGGGQQKGMRSGTDNVPGIAGIAKAVEEVYKYLDQDVQRLYSLKDYFVNEVLQIPDVKVNGYTGYDSAPHIVSVSIRGIRSEVVLHALEDRGIYVSAGSACSSHKPAPSATLKAIGVEKELLDSTIRFSFSIFTTKEEIDYTLKVLYDIIPMLRKYTRP